METFCENVLFTKDCLSQNLDFPLKQFRKPSTIAASSRKMRSFQFENSKTVYLWKFISKAAPFPSPPFKGFFGRNFFHWFSIAAFIIIIPISYAARLKKFHQNLSRENRLFFWKVALVFIRSCSYYKELEVFIRSISTTTSTYKQCSMWLEVSFIIEAPPKLWWHFFGRKWIKFVFVKKNWRTDEPYELWWNLKFACGKH